MAWIISSGELTSTEFPEILPISYPEAIWKSSGGSLKTGLMPEVKLLGAFANCTNLTRISIPTSVKFIGENTFRNTNLISVKIAPDCVYSPTSFPDNCKINFY